MTRFTCLHCGKQWNWEKVNPNSGEKPRWFCDVVCIDCMQSDDIVTVRCKYNWGDNVSKLSFREALDLFEESYPNAAFMDGELSLLYDRRI